MHLVEWLVWSDFPTQFVIYFILCITHIAICEPC